MIRLSLSIPYMNAPTPSAVGDSVGWRDGATEGEVVGPRVGAADGVFCYMCMRKGKAPSPCRPCTRHR